MNLYNVYFPFEERKKKRSIVKPLMNWEQAPITRAPKRWEWWERVLSQFEIFGATFG